MSMNSNPNRQRRWTDVRPLASLPNRPGHTIVGVFKDGHRERLIIEVDPAGHYTVPGYENLRGWVPA